MKSSVAIGDQVVVLDGRFGSITTTSLALKDDLRFNDWRELGEQIERFQQRSLWWVADWAAFGERQYRRDYGPALDALYARRSLHNLASVARRVESSRRRENLSFSHHVEVASLEPELQTVWLDDALRHGWSVHELRAQIAEWSGRKAPAPALTIKAIAGLYDLCSRAAAKLGVEPVEFARQALEQKAREVLGE